MSQASLLRFFGAGSSSSTAPSTSSISDSESISNSSSVVETDPGPVGHTAESTDPPAAAITITALVRPDPAENLPPSLTREERHRIISLGPCQPRDLEFPVTEHGGQKRIKRSFQPKWFDLGCAKQWLEYSKKADALFCFACRVFGAAGGLGESSEHRWMVTGVRGANWKNALQRIRKHNTSHFHIASMDSWKSYLEQTPVDCMMDEQQRLTVSRRQ